MRSNLHHTHALQVNVTDTHVATQSQLATINTLQNTPMLHIYSSTHIIPANRCHQHPHANPLFTRRCVAHKHYKGCTYISFCYFDALNRGVQIFYSPNTTLFKNKDNFRNCQKEINLSLKVG